MTDIFVDQLISLLGVHRRDKKILDFLDGFSSSKPIVTIDDADGANEEYIEFKSLGFCLYFDDESLISIFIHSAEDGTDYSAFECPLHMGLSLKMTRADVELLLGSPSQKGGGKDPFWGEIPMWVKYEFDRYYLHIEFRKGSEIIRMVTFEHKVA